jgi:hypothetical protein
MSHYNGVISAPVDLRRDVYPVRGSSSGGRYSLADVCSNIDSKTNKWSKIKPVEIEGNIFVHLDTDKVSMSHPFTGTYISVPAWLGRMYTETVYPGGSTIDEVLLAHIAGLGVPMLSGTNIATDSQKEATAKRIKRVVDNIETWGVNWEYKPPVPPTYPCRLTDFNGYDHYAQCPIYYTVPDKIYNGEHAWFSCSLIPEGQTSIDATWFSSFFPNYMICAVWFKGDNYLGFVEIEELSSGRGETALSPNAFYTLSGANAGEYRVYFFATDGDRSIIFPSLPDSPNPQTFTAVKGNNPKDDPFAGELMMDIYATGTGFAHSHTDSYFESFYNVGEGDYVSLCTTGYYCVKAKLVNGSSRALNFDPSQLSVYWAESSGSPSVIVYQSNGTLATSVISVPANGSVTIMIEFIDIYLGMSPVQGYHYGTIDPMSIRYKGAEVQQFYCDVVYDSSHNGYFTANGKYYKTK